jgi:hypothetical protein
MPCLEQVFTSVADPDPPDPHVFGPPDTLVRGMDPDPDTLVRDMDPDPDPDPSITMQK